MSILDNPYYLSMKTRGLSIDMTRRTGSGESDYLLSVRIIKTIKSTLEEIQHTRDEYELVLSITHKATRKQMDRIKVLLAEDPKKEVKNMMIKGNKTYLCAL